ncbi:MAG: hypothetical protein B6D78_11655 [gamma proteobacterium symbiont of Ctena orbiculata]|nr:MAG: hypothetical protein B6D78_11655 [gamma proteobacterium symbiont of Ctena orbiculata]PVV26874.1 MAG: hypothetical protein B6D79_04895 [gamma proteobacterium symbiont of Ctena orbiculata]
MDINSIFELSAAVLASVGGAGFIVVGFSSWLGKVWATRLMDSERHENQKILSEITEEIKRLNSVELEKLKSSLDISSHASKLDQEHEYDQKKKIKEVISKYKVRLIDSAESLNHRMWNFNSNYGEQWHFDTGKNVEDQYYLYSFVYRLLTFFSWCRLTEKDMIFLDSTVANKIDLDFVKFLKLLPQVMCDASLFDGLKYDHGHDTDHFFLNNFQSTLDQLYSEDGVISFDEFKNKITEGKLDVSNIVDFISGLSPEEDRLRWYRLQVMHYTLLMFINSFGYDFQHTGATRIKELKGKHKVNPCLKNLEKMISKIKLNQNNEVAAILDGLNA